MSRSVGSRRSASSLYSLMAVLALAAGCAPDSPDEGGMSTADASSFAMADLPPELTAVRTALDRFQDPIVALREGYFSTMGCLVFPGGASEGQMAYLPGGMGVHFLNTGYIAPTLDPEKPQVLLYEWAGDRLRLTGAEWFVPVAVSPEAPSIFGHTLEGPMEGHEPILPADLHHWDLHVWLWKENPNGLFHPTNSTVTCPEGPYTFVESPPTMVHMGH